MSIRRRELIIWIAGMVVGMVFADVDANWWPLGLGFISAVLYTVIFYVLPFPKKQIQGHTVIRTLREVAWCFLSRPLKGQKTMIRQGNEVVLPDYVMKVLRVKRGDAVFFHHVSDHYVGFHFKVLNVAQYEKLLQPL